MAKLCQGLKPRKRGFRRCLCLAMWQGAPYGQPGGNQNQGNQGALQPVNILVIGSGGREHALIWALHTTSASRPTLFCAPGNAGIAQLAECVPLNANDVESLATFAAEKSIDLTFVGGESPLAAGIVDVFTARGLAIIGPTKQAARLESSKAFAKDFMTRQKIPTAAYHVATSSDGSKSSFAEWQVRRR